jgi:hypothetical protein
MITKMLVRKAKDGDVYAPREILDRVVGKPVKMVEQAGDIHVHVHQP